MLYSWENKSKAYTIHSLLYINRTNHSYYCNLQYFLVAEVGALVVAQQINCCHEHVRCLSPGQAPDLYTITDINSLLKEYFIEYNIILGGGVHHCKLSPSPVPAETRRTQNDGKQEENHNKFITS